MTVRYIDLDAQGRICDSASGRSLDSPEETAEFLSNVLTIPAGVSDIFVFVHGWQNTPTAAGAAATRLFRLIDERAGAERHGYPALQGFSPYYVGVRWPSVSSPLWSGYRRIRSRAHLLSAEGSAAWVLAEILGYLDSQRNKSARGPKVLKTRQGQFLHCVGHSLGGRVLGEALLHAAEPKGPPRLGWPWRSAAHPFTTDTLVLFQMAAPPHIFEGEFRGLLGGAPLNGPIVLTYSAADRATGLWHWLAEGQPGIGTVGAADVRSVRMRGLTESYAREDFIDRIINVDASTFFRRGRWTYPQGVHSDYQRAESAHLLLSLAALAR